MFDLANQQIVIEELRRTFDKAYAAGDALDTKLNNLLNFSSLIVVFATTVPISTLQSQLGLIFWFVLAYVLWLYVKNFRVITNGLAPQKYLFTVSEDKDVIIEKYLMPPEQQVLSQLLVNNVRSIKDTLIVNEIKASAVKQSSNLLLLIVVSLIVAVVLGLIFSAPTLGDTWKWFLHLLGI